MLTPSKAKFTAEYIRTGNATQSAITAGYSAKTAKSQGSRLLTDVDVKQALEAAGATAGQRIEAASSRAVTSAVLAIVTKDMVLKGLLGIARDKKIPPSVRRSAWRDLGEHLSLFRTVVDHNIVAGLAEQLGLDPLAVEQEAEAILRGSR